MEKIFEKFNPAYNSVEQVIRNASYLMNDEVIDAKVAIVIGHNGRNFVSSSDWRIETKTGEKRIFQFSARPQYPNFIECVAGVNYFTKGEKFFVIPDDEGTEKSAKVILDGKEYDFAPGKAIKIYVEADSKFIATDCLVECKEDENCRTYRIITDDDTVYGWSDAKRHISRL